MWITIYGVVEKSEFRSACKIWNCIAHVVIMQCERREKKTSTWHRSSSMACLRQLRVAKTIVFSSLGFSKHLTEFVRMMKWKRSCSARTPAIHHREMSREVERHHNSYFTTMLPPLLRPINLSCQWVCTKILTFTIYVFCNVKIDAKKNRRQKSTLFVMFFLFLAAADR